MLAQRGRRERRVSLWRTRNASLEAFTQTTELSSGLAEEKIY